MSTARGCKHRRPPVSTPRVRADQFLTAQHARACASLSRAACSTTTAPAVVLLHGGSAHARWWDHFAAAIGDAYHVVALDLRGHGDSEHADPPAYRIDDYAGDVRPASTPWSCARRSSSATRSAGMVAHARRRHVHPSAYARW